MSRLSELLGFLGKKAPTDWAESWDNVGLIAGDASAEVKGVIVTVNLGREALDAATDVGANVIVCHHPPVFKPTLKLTKAAHPYVFEALQKGIAVYAAHTNFDLASKATNQKIAAALGGEYEAALAPRGGDGVPASNRLGKFITYVPLDSFEKVRKAICDAGAGGLGNYRDCTFSWEGEGTFRGVEGSNPTVGKPGQLERTKERRLEAVFPWKKLSQVVDAAREVHPYEEMAYDVIALDNPHQAMGYGFIARPKAGPLTFHKLIESVKTAFQLRNVEVSGPVIGPKLEDWNRDLPVKKFGFSPGSGSGFVGSAIAQGLDVYICGEMGYHQVLEARRAGVNIVLLGHSYSERFFVETLHEWCSEWLKEKAPKVAASKVFETVHSVL